MRLSSRLLLSPDGVSPDHLLHLFQQLTYACRFLERSSKPVFSKAAAAGKLHWLNATPPEGTSWLKFLLGKPFNIWMGIIGGTVMVMSSHGAEQLIVQRVLACKTVADGRKALALSAVVIFPLFLIFLLVGAMLWVFYQGHPMQIALPESQPGMANNNYIFPIFMMTEIPHVLKGFLMGRSPIRGFAASNGHGRAQAGLQPVARQGNLIVTSTRQLPFARLRDQLIQEAINIREGKTRSSYRSRIVRAITARAFLQLIIAACDI